MRILALTMSGALSLAGVILATRVLQSPLPAKACSKDPKVTKPSPKWSHDLTLAQAEARTGQRFVLVNVTGSDWCGWCLRLRRELFTRPEFVAYSETNLVLVEVDFPREDRQGAEQRAANAAAARRFGVKRVPALLLLDCEGRVLRTWGFEDGGVRHYLAEFRKAIADSHPDLTTPPAGEARGIEAVHENVPRTSATKTATTSDGSSRESSRRKQSDCI